MVSGNNPNLVRELFDRVSAEPRDRWDKVLETERRLGADPAVIDRVRELLGFAGDAASRAPGGVAGPLQAHRAEMERLIDDARTRRIGRYTIIRVLGEGGMGTVYEAEQENPRRIVALKVIRAGYLSPELLRRFVYESQVLGRLQHPGIAQVYEAGTVQDDRGRPLPFFAMEFIKGAALTDYAAQKKLGTRERLELIARVCDAVYHAHQKGVIHRDLKPGNILVDESGQPKVLDFGVARATDSDIQQTTLGTDIGQLIGTVPYMSPEQVGGSSDDLDTRSDVYALGVIAFELLAGRLPYELKQKMIAEAARVIREEEPTRLSSFDRTLRGDVETIVAKALEKDRTRRYQSAESLASDIRHYLRDEPIAARPASTWYQLSKFSRRNKELVGGVGTAIAALVIGTGVAIYFAAEATRNARIADDGRTQAEAAKTKLQKTNLDLLEKTADAGRRGAEWRQVLEACDRALAAGAKEEIGWRVRRVEALDALDMLIDADAEVNALAARSDLGSNAATVTLWRADMTLSLGGDKASVGAAVNLLQEALGPDGKGTALSTADAEYARGLLADTWPKAADHLAKAMAQDPSHVRATSMLAIALLMSGRADEAIQHLRALETFAHPLPGPRFLLATALSMTGRHDESKVVLRRLKPLVDKDHFIAMQAFVGWWKDSLTLDGAGPSSGINLGDFAIRLPKLIGIMNKAFGHEVDSAGRISRGLGLRDHPLLSRMKAEVYRAGRGLLETPQVDAFNLILPIIEPCDEAVGKYMHGWLQMKEGNFAEAEQLFVSATTGPGLIDIRGSAWLQLSGCYAVMSRAAGDAERTSLRNKTTAALHRAYEFGGVPIKLAISNCRVCLKDPMLDGLLLTNCEELRWRFPGNLEVQSLCAAAYEAVGAYGLAEEVARSVLQVKPESKDMVALLARLDSEKASWSQPVKPAAPTH